MKQRAARAGGDWFPYYSGVSTSDRVLRLRAKKGLEGFGLYVLLLERQLRRNEGIKPQDYEIAAYELQTKPEEVRAVIEDFDLFHLGADGETYYNYNLVHQPTTPPCCAPQFLHSPTHPNDQEVSTATGKHATCARVDGPQFAATKNDAKSTVSTLYMPTPNGSNEQIFGSDEETKETKEKERFPPAPPSKEKEKKEKEITLDDDDGFEQKNSEKSAYASINIDKKKLKFKDLTSYEQFTQAAEEFPQWRVAMEEKTGGRAALNEFCRQFFARCLQNGRQHNTAVELRGHFNSWLDIQLTNQTHNHDTPTTKSQTGTRTAAVPPAAFARTMPGSLEARLGYTEGCGVKRRPTPPD